jgi:hypothetical protein
MALSSPKKGHSRILDVNRAARLHSFKVRVVPPCDKLGEMTPARSTTPAGAALRGRKPQPADDRCCSIVFGVRTIEFAQIRLRELETGDYWADSERGWRNDFLLMSSIAL